MTKTEGAITERGKSLLRTYKAPAVTPSPEVPYFEAGGSTFHTHTCPKTDTSEAHSWMCNSPYCNTLNDLCPDHGGEEPIKIGREPWRR